MFRALLCPSSGAHVYDVDYRIGRFVLFYDHNPQTITTITINRNTLEATTKRQTTSHRTQTTKKHNFTLTLHPPSLQNETTNVVISIIVASS